MTPEISCWATSNIVLRLVVFSSKSSPLHPVPCSVHWEDVISREGPSQRSACSIEVFDLSGEQVHKAYDIEGQERSGIALAYQNSLSAWVWVVELYVRLPEEGPNCPELQEEMHKDWDVGNMQHCVCGMV